VPALQSLFLGRVTPAQPAAEPNAAEAGVFD
jgi:hypothetical protein